MPACILRPIFTEHREFLLRNAILGNAHGSWFEVVQGRDGRPERPAPGRVVDREVRVKSGVKPAANPVEGRARIDGSAPPRIPGPERVFAHGLDTVPPRTDP